MIPTDLTAAPSSDPLRVYRYRDGLYAVDLLSAAVVHLDLFNWLAGQAEAPTEAGMRAHLGLAERPADVLVTLLVANGFLERREGALHLTEVAREFLLAGSPWDVTPYYASMKDRPVCLDFLKVLRTGKPANWSSLEDENDWHRAMETEEFASSFTAAMDCRGALLGQKLAAELNLEGFDHVLDIGGGSGIYACSLVAANPHLRATVMEKEPVDRIARECIEKRGFSERVKVVVGEMFGDVYPEECDVHLFSNVLHDWDIPEVKALLARSAEALPAGGLLVVHEAFLNEDKTGPLPVAEYSALLMNVTQGKCYSTSEMREFMTGAGFEWVGHLDTVIDRGFILARKP
jgi:predicted O-methyltransferase YrrM